MPDKRQRRPWPLALAGLALLALSGWLLVSGEWRSAARTADLEAAGAGLAVLDPQAPRSDARGAVLVQGPTRVLRPPVDPLLGVTADVLRLDRRVEMYQWREHREGTGDEETLTYEKVWSAELIDSSRFRQRLAHANPGSMPIAAASFAATEARLGRLPLAPELLAALPASAPVETSADELTTRSGRAFTRAGAWLQTGDPGQPAIGALRLRFEGVPAGTISVVAGLEGGRLVPWLSPAGRPVALAAPGLVGAPELLGTAHREDWLATWQKRLGGGFLAVVAMLMLRAVAGLGGRGPGPALAGALLAAGAFTLACIAGGWLLFRPLSGALLLAGGAGTAMAAAFLLAGGRRERR